MNAFPTGGACSCLTRHSRSLRQSVMLEPTTTVSGTLPSSARDLVLTTKLVRSLSGRNLGGILSQVFRPIITTLLQFLSVFSCFETSGRVDPAAGVVDVRLVTRAK